MSSVAPCKKHGYEFDLCDFFPKECKEEKTTTYLSAGFRCTFCDDFAPSHDNGMFKFIVKFSQTGEWGMTCEKCAENPENAFGIDLFYKQDKSGMASLIEHRAISDR